ICVFLESALVELALYPRDVILNDVPAPSGVRPTKMVEDRFIHCQVNQVAQSIEVGGCTDQEPPWTQAMAQPLKCNIPRTGEVLDDFGKDDRIKRLRERRFLAAKVPANSLHALLTDIIKVVFSYIGNGRVVVPELFGQQGVLT